MANLKRYSELLDLQELRNEEKIRAARKCFFNYCNLKAPDFYKDDRKYLVELCNDMQEFLNSDEEVLIINEPPRHGKSRTAGLFVEWVLGRDQSQKVMTGSYNETLSTMFSKNVRNDILEVKADKYKPVFSDVFPGVTIKHGDGAMNLWSLEGGYNNYLATSPTGTATGFGCSLMIIDDLIKNAEEAYNESVKEKHWDWFTNTMLSRLEEGGKILIIMTRWASGDLAGKAINWCQKENKKFRLVSMKAIQDDGSMLCDEVLSYKSAMTKKSAMGEDIFMANYQQEPIDLKGCLYKSFKTYDKEPDAYTGIKCYIDTADKGADYLCSIIYGVYMKLPYIRDVYYTQDPMSTTEKETAKRLLNYDVRECLVESNNGGEGFARNVEREYKALGGNRCRFKTFHQSKNKEARILSNSSWVEDNIYYPENWRSRWPDYYNAMISYQREGKNAHDDAPDATTGVAEQFMSKSRMSFLKPKKEL